MGEKPDVAAATLQSNRKSKSQIKQNSGLEIMPMVMGEEPDVVAAATAAVPKVVFEPDVIQHGVGDLFVVLRIRDSPAWLTV